MFFIVCLGSRAEYGGREGFFHVTRGVEGFDVQGGVVRKVGMSSSIEVLFEVVGVFEADGPVCYE